METDHRYVISLTHFEDGKITEHKCFYIDEDDYDFYLSSHETLLEFCQTPKNE